jgi:hypothetical protein
MAYPSIADLMQRTCCSLRCAALSTIMANSIIAPIKAGGTPIASAIHSFHVGIGH